MHIAILHLELYLPGCQSLKDKRRRIRGLKDRYGGLTQVAICESDFQDTWQRGAYDIVCLALQRSQIESIFSKIDVHIRDNLDAELTRSEIEWL